MPPEQPEQEIENQGRQHHQIFITRKPPALGTELIRKEHSRYEDVPFVFIANRSFDSVLLTAVFV